MTFFFTKIQIANSNKLFIRSYGCIYLRLCVPKDVDAENEKAFTIFKKPYGYMLEL